MTRPQWQPCSIIPISIAAASNSAGDQEIRQEILLTVLCEEVPIVRACQHGKIQASGTRLEVHTPARTAKPWAKVSATTRVVPGDLDDLVDAQRVSWYAER